VQTLLTIAQFATAFIAVCTLISFFYFREKTKRALCEAKSLFEILAQEEDTVGETESEVFAHEQQNKAHGYACKAFIFLVTSVFSATSFALLLWLL
jgi:hypothetical protein